MSRRLATTFRNWLSGSRPRRAGVVSPARQLSVESLERRSLLSAATATTLEYYDQPNADGTRSLPTSLLQVWQGERFEDRGGMGAVHFDLEATTAAPTARYGAHREEFLRVDPPPPPNAAPFDRGPAALVIYIFHTSPRSAPVGLRADNGNTAGLPDGDVWATPAPPEDPMAAKALAERLGDVGNRDFESRPLPSPLSGLLSTTAPATDSNDHDVEQVEASLASLAYDAAFADATLRATWRGAPEPTRLVELNEMVAPTDTERSTALDHAYESLDETPSLRDVADDQTREVADVLQELERRTVAREHDDRHAEPHSGEALPSFADADDASPAEGGMVLLSTDAADFVSMVDDVEAQSRGFFSPVSLEPAIGMFQAFDVASSEPPIAIPGGSSATAARDQAAKSTDKGSTDADSTPRKASSASRLMAAAAGVVAATVAIRTLPRRVRRRRDPAQGA